MVREKEWKEVRRRKQAESFSKFKRDDPSLTSFYIYNLPGDANRRELWNHCAKLGKLADVYVAARRDISGSFFGFVRFADVKEPDEIVAGLKSVRYRGRWLNANGAKRPRTVVKADGAEKAGRGKVLPSRSPWVQSARVSRSFADVARGRNSNASPEAIALGSFQEIKNWSSHFVLMGEARNFDSLCNFPSLVQLEGFNVVESKYLGGLLIAIKFNSAKAAQVFKENKNIWL